MKTGAYEILSSKGQHLFSLCLLSKCSMGLEVEALAFEIQRKGVALGIKLVELETALKLDSKFSNMTVQDYMLTERKVSWKFLSHAYQAAKTAARYEISNTEALKLGVGKLELVNRAGSKGEAILKHARTKTYNQTKNILEGKGYAAETGEYFGIQDVYFTDVAWFKAFARKNECTHSEAFHRIVVIMKQQEPKVPVVTRKFR